MVWQVAKAVKVPLIGIGGIMSATDALEFILAGATAVQIGTANFLTPAASQEIALGMEQWLMENRVESLRELIGSLNV
jgi:dihydroorotate dehydrogenase (NAD+) catalytic subunit